MEIVIAVVVLAAVVALFGLWYARRPDRATPIEAPTRPAPPVAPSAPSAPTAEAPVVEAPEIAPPAEAPPVEAPPAEPSVEPSEEVVAPEPEVLVRPRLRDRIGKTRAAFVGALRGVAGRRIDDDTWDDLEEALLLADVGLPTTERLLTAVKQRAKETKLDDAGGIEELLRAEIVALLDPAHDRSLHLNDGARNVWMFVGVNGVGKTTTIGKLAAQQVAAGRSVVLAAGDTFRAAASEQLGQWGERVGAPVVRGQEGADPGSVVFDAMSAANGRDADLVLVDTAGRLHTKVNLMEELKKLKRIVERTPDSLREVLLVVDATTGQNGLSQARQFAEAVDVTGIVLTKLDGSAKGGIVLAIQHELGLPVKVVGVGETVGDLIEFDPEEFAAGLFEE